jgi:transposase
LYLEGLGFRTIGRILQISYGTVYLWVKEWTLQQSLPRSSVAANMVTLDKIQSYVASKNAATTHGLLLIDLEKNISLLSVKSGLQIKLQSPIIN